MNKFESPKYILTTFIQIFLIFTVLITSNELELPQIPKRPSLKELKQSLKIEIVDEKELYDNLMRNREHKNKEKLINKKDKQ